MERIKRVLALVFRNIYYYRVDYIRVFVAVRVLQILCVIPVITVLFKFMLETLGIQSVTEQNIWHLLGHPLVWTVLICIVLVVLIFIYYEIGMLMLLAYHQQRAIPYTLIGLIKRLNRKVLYFLSFQTLIFVLYVMLIIPLISSILPSTVIQSLQIPHFIVDELLGSTRGRLLYYGAIFFLTLIGLRFIFTMPFFTVYQWTTIWDAVKLSWKFSNRKLIEMFGMLGLILAVHLTLSLTVLSIVFLPLYVFEQLSGGSLLVLAAFTLTFAEGVLIVAFSLLQAIFSQILVLVAFKLTHEKPLIKQNESFRDSIWQWTIVLATFSYFLLSGFNIISLEKTIYEPDTLIVAHRGFMQEGVENTISSLVASAEAGAEIVEIDIQQTKDGEFVVFHDTTLTRLAGVPTRVYEMTQQELMNVTVSADGLTDKIPSLEQMLEASELYGTRLLIELKTHGHETDDFLQRMIDVIDDYGMLDVHYIQSSNVTLMEEIKAMEPRLKVGAVYAMNFGALPETTVDFYSFEQYFVTEKLINQAKEQNKDLFVWTVNEDRGLQRFLELNVDGIITNHPDVAYDIREGFDESTYFLRRVWNKINYIF